MLKQLIKIANQLDKKGYYKETNMIDELIKRIAEDNLGEGASAVHGQMGETIERARQGDAEAVDSLVRELIDSENRYSKRTDELNETIKTLTSWVEELEESVDPDTRQQLQHKYSNLL